MISADKRKAIFLLHQEGMSVREIARKLAVGRNTVRKIIAQGGGMPNKACSAPQIDPELLRQLHAQCQGYVQRMHEKLQEEHGIRIKYSTLTRLLRQLGIGRVAQTRCERVPDEPGAEMQHDTSPYTVGLAGVEVKLIASLLYLRYSKRRYLRFYRAFDRFGMKCFLHEALLHWGCAPLLCIIDNTNLARLRGLGPSAVIAPEMEAFSKAYGFCFVCHAKGHADRKAGEERSFWTVETNFFPGRAYQSLEDLNQQALEWASVRLEHRPQGKAKLIPAKAFEHERSFLTGLSAHLPAPYQILERSVDHYGHAAFDGNFYWVPGTGRGSVQLLRYAERIQIHQHRQCLIEYSLPPHGVSNQLFFPPGHQGPRHRAHTCKAPTQQEEQRLRALDPSLSAYVDFVLATPGLARHMFLRKLLALSQRMTSELFIRSIQRAHRYKITRLDVLENIALLLLNEGIGELPKPQVDEALQERPAYVEGSLTDSPDLSQYHE